MRLKGKVALVTGGGSGMGLATARLFASEGARVAVVDMDETAGQRGVAAIRQAGGDARYFQADVSRSADVQRAVAATVEAFGALNVLVANAGVGAQGAASAVETLDEDEWERVMNVNLKGVFLCAKHAVPEMKRAGGGAIVNTASIGGLVSPTTTPHAYCASKAGVISLTRTLATELVQHRIRVNAVAPGFVNTPMLRGASRGADEAQQAATLAHWSAQMPMGRVATPEELAQAFLYLASDEASYVTGHTLIVDGGFTVI